MSDIVCKPNKLKNFSKEILKKLEIKEQEAEIISDILITADLRGISSHGIARLPIYAKRIELGLINPKPAIKILKENQTSALLDADNGMGHIASHNAMELCIQKAKKAGMASAAVKNSNHFGIKRKRRSFCVSTLFLQRKPRWILVMWATPPIRVGEEKPGSLTCDYPIPAWITMRWSMTSGWRPLSFVISMPFTFLVAYPG